MSTHRIFRILKYVGWILLVPFVSCLAWRYTDAMFAVLVFVCSLSAVLLYEVINLEWKMKRTYFSGAPGGILLLVVAMTWPNLPVVHPTIIVGAVVYGILIIGYTPRMMKFIMDPILEQIGW